MVLGPAVDKPRVEPRPPEGFPTPGDDVDLPPTPEDIQVNPAAFEDFDQTYLARREQWRLAGPRPSPAPFPLQVLPRMAFTVNYNFVFDDDQEEWVPQNPFDGGGGGSLAASTLVQTSAQSIAGGSPPGVQQITFGSAPEDGLGAADVANDQLVIPEDGVYLVQGAIELDDVLDQGGFNTILQVNGSTSRVGFETQSASSSGPVNDGVSKWLTLSEGDEVTLHIFSTDNSDTDDDAARTFLQAAGLVADDGGGGGGGGGGGVWSVVEEQTTTVDGTFGAQVVSSISGGQRYIEPVVTFDQTPPGTGSAALLSDTSATGEGITYFKRYNGGADAWELVLSSDTGTDIDVKVLWLEADPSA